MRCDEDVAGQAFQRIEAFFEVRQRGGVGLAVGKAKTVSGHRCQAVGVNHVDAAGGIAGLPRPTRASGRVPRGLVRR